MDTELIDSMMLHVFLLTQPSIREREFQDIISEQGPEYVPNTPFQWSSFLAASTGVGSFDGSTVKSADSDSHTIKNVNRAGDEGFYYSKVGP